MYRLIKHTSIRTVMDAWNILYASNTRLTPYQEYSYCSIIGEYSAVLKLKHLKNVIYELRDTHDQTIMVIPLHIKRTKLETIAYLWGEISQSGHLDLISMGGFNLKFFSPRWN